MTEGSGGGRGRGVGQEGGTAAQGRREGAVYPFLSSHQSVEGGVLVALRVKPGARQTQVMLTHARTRTNTQARAKRESARARASEKERERERERERESLMRAEVGCKI